MYDLYDDMEKKKKKKKGKEKKRVRSWDFSFGAKVWTNFISLLNLRIKIILKCKNKYNMKNKTRILSVLTIYKKKKDTK